MRSTFKRRRNNPWLKPGACLAVIVLGVLVLAAVLAPWVAPFDPIAQNLDAKMQGMSWSHPLGTDLFGRDVLSRLIWGGRNAFGGVLIALSVTIVLGVTWGTVAGFWPRAGNILMRACDAMIAFPTLVLAIAITGSLGKGLTTSMVAIGLVLAPNTAQLTRTGVLALRKQDFVSSARLSGVPAPVLLWRHILPIALRPVVIQLTIFTGLTFVVQGALSYLGLGVPRPAPSWGGDLNDAYSKILSAPWHVVPPGVLLGVVVLCVYRIGDVLRDRMSNPIVETDRAENDVVVV